MRGLLLRGAGLALTLMLAACATGGHSDSPTPDANTIATTQVSATPDQVFAAATDVMGRYSYSISRVQYPTSATFEKTGNSPNLLATSSPAFLTLHVAQTGAGSRISFSGDRATLQTEAVKTALEQIKTAIR